MKILRVVLTVLAVCAAAFLAFRGLSGSAVAPEPPPQKPSEPGGKSIFDNLHGPGEPLKPTNGASTAPMPQPVERPPTGIPVGASDTVSVVVPYRKGLKSRYRVTEAQGTMNRESEATAWFQFVWKMRAEVTDGDGTGPAKIQVRVDAFRYRTEKDGRGIEFDSEAPDEKLLEDDVLALAVRPRMATLGMPLEFTVDSAHRITNIAGVESMNRKHLDAVDAVGAKYVADATEAPSTDNLTERWSELLFPAFGSGAMKGSDSRAAFFRTTWFERWAARSDGAFRVTHTEGDTFRIAFVGKPELEERQIEPRAPLSLSIGKVRVLSDKDAYRSAWMFDGVKGRLAGSSLSAKYQVHVSRPMAPDPAGQMQYEKSFFDVVRILEVELLED